MTVLAVAVVVLLGAPTAAAVWLVFFQAERWQDEYRDRMATQGPWHSHLDEQGRRRPCRIPAADCARWAREIERTEAA